MIICDNCKNEINRDKKTNYIIQTIREDYDIFKLYQFCCQECWEKFNNGE